MEGQFETADRAPSLTSVAPRKRGVAARITLGVVALLAVAGGAYWVVTSRQDAPAAIAAAPPRPAVTVSPPLQRNVAQTTDFTGQFFAVDQVELHARVSGYLTEIHSTDGQIVRRGDLLYVIDPRPDAIQLQQAVGQY